MASRRLRRFSGGGKAKNGWSGAAVRG